MLQILNDYGIIPFVKADTEAEALVVAKALSDGGLPVMELVLRTFAHSRAIRKICREMPDFIIGAGNILNHEQLERAIDCGAKFILSPGSETELLRGMNKLKTLFAPGVCSPSDIQRSVLYGAEQVQYFPAEASGGITMLDSIIDPFAHLGIQVFVKGGITLENAGAYLKRPYVAALSAPWIATPERIKNGDWKAITLAAKDSLEFVLKNRKRK